MIDRRSRRLSPAARFCAGIVAAVSGAGLAIQADATYAMAGSAAATMWALAGFFTILANLLVAMLFAAVAAGLTPPPRWLAGATLAIMLVGIVFALLLRGLLVLSGGALLANALLHYAAPLLAPLWWLAFAPKGGLRRSDPWRWALFPAAYLPWALARGAATGRFAYPFLDGARHGWGHVALICAIIAIGYVAAGAGLIRLDHALAATNRSGR